MIFTRTAPAQVTRPPGRINADDIRPRLCDGLTVYVCGSAGFAAAATDCAIEAGVDAQAIRVERFGPTG